MARRLACSDAGYDCSHVAEGDSVEQVLEEVAPHAKAVHGFTDEQLNDPEVIARIRTALKQT